MRRKTPKHGKRVCAAEHCDNVFEAQNWRRKYCSDDCSVYALCECGARYHRNKGGTGKCRSCGCKERSLDERSCASCGEVYAPSVPKQRRCSACVKARRHGKCTCGNWLSRDAAQCRTCKGVSQIGITRTFGKAVCACGNEFERKSARHELCIECRNPACQVCGKRLKSRESRWCPDCWYASLRDKRKRYHAAFKRMRPLIHERDKTCRLCGVEFTGGRSRASLAIHHIDNQSSTKSDQSPLNLVALCISCNARIGAGDEARDELQRYAKEATRAMPIGWHEQVGAILA